MLKFKLFSLIGCALFLLVIIIHISHAEVELVKLSGEMQSFSGVEDFRVSSTGELAVFVADTEVENAYNLYSTSIDNPNEPVKLSGPIIIPDGEEYIRSNNQFNYVISPDNEWVVVNFNTDNKGQLQAIPILGGDAVPLLNEEKGELVDHYSVGPNSEWIVYLSTQGKLYIASLSSGLISSVVDDVFVISFHISADGQWVVYSARENSSHSQPRGLLKSIRTDAASHVTLHSSDSELDRWDISPNGSFVVYEAVQEDQGQSQELRTLFRVDIDGSTKIQLTDPKTSSNSWDLQISNDNNYVIYHADLDEIGANELYSIPSKGGELIKLNGELISFGDVDTWLINVFQSEDGKWILYSADQEKNEFFDIYSVPTDGSQSPVKLIEANASSSKGSKIPAFVTRIQNSEYVIYPKITEAKYQFVKVPIGGGEHIEVGPAVTVKNKSDFHYSIDSNHECLFYGESELVHATNLNKNQTYILNLPSFESIYYDNIFRLETDISLLDLFQKRSISQQKPYAYFFAKENAQKELFAAKVNNPPTIVSTPRTWAINDFAYVAEVKAEDLCSGETLVISALTLPEWLKVKDVDEENGTAILSGIPSKKDIGKHEVLIQVEDEDGLISRQTFTINVEDFNQISEGRVVFMPLITNK